MIKVLDLIPEGNRELDIILDENFTLANSLVKISCKMVILLRNLSSKEDLQ